MLSIHQLAKSITNKKLAIIASDHGIGHIKRSVSLANLISESKKYSISIYADISKINKVNKELKLNPKIRKINFKPQIEKIIKKKNIYNEVMISLPELDNFDLVISDNIPEVFNKNKNCILISNFLWSDLLKKNNHSYYLKIEKILKNKNIKIIQNYLFGMKLKCVSKIHKVGFFEFKKINNNIIKDKSIMFCIGNTDDESIKPLKIIEDLKKIDKSYQIFIEPRFFNSELPSNFFKMQFTMSFFRKIKFSIIRPGLATINNCLSNQIIIFSLKSKNKEMIYNSKILLEKKLGLEYKNINSLKSILNQDNFTLIKYEKLQFCSLNQIESIINS